jgi:predicted RNA methylase
MAFCTILAMAAACGDRDAVTCVDFDAELVHAASETAARQSEIAIATEPRHPT